MRENMYEILFIHLQENTWFRFSKNAHKKNQGSCARFERNEIILFDKWMHHLETTTEHIIWPTM